MTKKPAVAVVDAKTPGNIGTIARAMKNFGFEELLLVNPPDIEKGDEAHGFAGQAKEDVLANRQVLDFEEIIEQYHTIGFTAETTEDQTNHLRHPFFTPRELVEELDHLDSSTALVFGRERVGLSLDELEKMDRIASIPANSRYPVLNLGQAATVALYELRELTLEKEEVQHPVEDVVERRRADEEMIENFHAEFEDFLDVIDQPQEKRRDLKTAVRRILGRSNPTKAEMNKLFGVMERTRRKIEWDR